MTKRKDPAKPRPGPSFTATLEFMADFRYAWGYLPRCCLCGRRVQHGERVKWGQWGNPETLRHHDCTEKPALAPSVAVKV